MCVCKSPGRMLQFFYFYCFKDEHLTKYIFIHIILQPSAADVHKLNIVLFALCLHKLYLFKKHLLCCVLALVGRGAPKRKSQRKCSM